MKIVSITAGAGGMYCGSCIRDNALAAELIARGHDLVLVPLYTPTTTDEPNVSQDRVFFGGVSVYLQQHVPLFRKTPWLVDRLWDAPWVLRAVAGHGVDVDARRLGALTISMLEGERGNQGKEFRKLIDWLRADSPPDIVSLPNSLLIALARPLKKALGRPVCCTLQGEDLFLERLGEPFRSRAIQLIAEHVGSVDLFLAVSDYYAGFMSRYLRIPMDRMRVVPLGINLHGYDEAVPGPRTPGPGPRIPHPGSAAADPVASRPYTIGYLARVAPEKGLHLLVDAYRLLRAERGLPESRLEVAGYLAPDQKPYLAGLEQRLREGGLDGEFRYRGALGRPAKIEFLRTLDVLSVPATYDEPKGMFLLEAMASGVPVVQPRRGAFTEIVERTGGGILVAPDDPASLADGLKSIWADRSGALEMGRRGRRAVRDDYSVARMADRALDVYQEVLRF